MGAASDVGDPERHKSVTDLYRTGHVRFRWKRPLGITLTVGHLNGGRGQRTSRLSQKDEEVAVALASRAGPTNALRCEPYCDPSRPNRRTKTPHFSCSERM